MKSWQKHVLISAGLLGVGTTAATVLAFAGGWWWPLDLLAHFRAQYVVLGVAALIPCIALRHWVLTAASALGAVVNLAVVIPLYLGPGSAGDLKLSILSFNVNAANRRSADIIGHIRERDADVTVIEELNLELDDRIRRSFPEWRWISQPRSDSFGIGVLTRLPIRQHSAPELASAGVPAIDIELEVAGKPIRILAVHTLPPVNADYAHRRDRMLEAVAEWVGAADHSRIVVGDLNATAWSSPLRRLLADTALVNSQRGFGLAASWPGGLPVLAIAIDHCLHTPDLVAKKRELGPFLGSDHRPLYVELAEAVSRD